LTRELTKKVKKTKAKSRRVKKKVVKKKTLPLVIALTVSFVVVSIVRVLLPVLGKEMQYSILDMEKTILGVQSGTVEWNFSEVSEYTLSDNIATEISGGIVKLIQKDQTDSDNTVSGFGAGTNSETQWNGGSEWVELTATGQTNGSGDFVSRIFDVGGSASWESMSWVPQRPMYKELPSNAQTETVYSTGNANMSGNILLTHMNESSGAIVDSSGQGNNGTYNGILYSQAGKLGGAIGFDGTDDYVDCGNTADGDYTSMTISSWWKATSFPGAWITMLHRNDGTSVGSSVFFIGLESGSHQIVATIGAGSGPGYMAGATGINAQIGTWYHVVNSWDGTTARVYVDGVEVNTYPLSSAAFNNKVANTKIGSSGFGNGYLFGGVIDETGIWSRNLSPTEVLDIYKRGAVRLKLQVRSGDTDPLTGDFVGPDGTTGNYYEELSNTTLGTPSFNLTNVSDNRYFQYKAYFETDNASYTPELKNVTIGPDHYTPSSPTVSNNTGTAYTQLTSFAEVLGTNNEGVVRYQISNDNVDWYYWDGTQWSKETGQGAPSEASTASNISSNLSTFQSSVGIGDFYFRAFLTSDSTQQVEIDSIELNYSTGTADPPPDDDEEEEEESDDTKIVYVTQKTTSDKKEEVEETTPEVEEDKFEIYMALLNSDDNGEIQLKGLAYEEVWIVAKYKGETIMATFVDTKEWEMNFSIDNIKKNLEPGENIIEINAYDEERNLLDSKEVTILGEEDYKIDHYQTIKDSLDISLIFIGSVDMASGGAFLVRNYKKGFKFPKRRVKKK